MWGTGAFETTCVDRGARLLGPACWQYVGQIGSPLRFCSSEPPDPGNILLNGPVLDHADAIAAYVDRRRMSGSLCRRCSIVSQRRGLVIAPEYWPLQADSMPDAGSRAVPSGGENVFFINLDSRKAWLRRRGAAERSRQG